MHNAPNFAIQSIFAIIPQLAECGGRYHQDCDCRNAKSGLHSFWWIAPGFEINSKKEDLNADWNV